MVAFDMGWELAKPFHSANSYDYVVRMQGRQWETVQVKSAYLDDRENRKPYWATNIRRAEGRQYSRDAFDWLFTTDGENKWLIPWNEINNHRSSISINNSKFDTYKLA